MEKIIIDTDIGDDIDDAFAIALMLESKRAECLGITVCFGEVDKKARLAKKLLTLWNRADIPVYAGLSYGERRDIVPGPPCQWGEELKDDCYKSINNVEIDCGQGAVDFLIGTAEKSNYDITLLAIGPLMNVAAAIKKAPETMKRLKRIVLMSGCFYRHIKEWNTLCDPDGADIVYRSGVPIAAVSLDTTETTWLSEKDCSEIARKEGDKQKYLHTLVERHRAYHGTRPCLHDPLAFWYCVQPDILETERLSVKVDTEGRFTRGMTLNCNTLVFNKEKISAETVEIDASVKCNGKKFVKLFMDILFS